MQISCIMLIIANIIVFVILPLAVFCCTKNSIFKKILKISLIFLYIVELVVFTMFRVEIGYMIEINADFSGQWFNKEIWMFDGWNIIDVIINTIMLIPLGVFIYKQELGLKNILRALICGFCVGFGIELMQFVLPVYRTVQVQDLLFNSISVSLGTAITILTRKLFIRVKKGE